MTPDSMAERERIDDPLEAVIRPIVEGQLRSFTYDHPEVLDAVDWFKPRPDKRLTFVNSIAKRIIRDLLGAGNRARLVEALAANVAWREAEEGAPQGSGGVDAGHSYPARRAGAHHPPSVPVERGDHERTGT